MGDSPATAGAELPALLSRYSKSDEATRNVIDRELKRIDWYRRQSVWLEWAGLLVGAVLVTGIFGWCVWLIANGHALPGTVIAGVDLAAIATVFVVRGRTK